MTDSCVRIAVVDTLGNTSQYSVTFSHCHLWL